jgi:signal transduction histidine kinase
VARTHSFRVVPKRAPNRVGSGEARRTRRLPPLAETGDHDLDRLVRALNATSARLDEERRRAGMAERLAAVGRLSAGLAHEIRNPIAAMRLKAENALATEAGRSAAALRFILEQVARLDGLLRDLLAMTQKAELRLGKTALGTFLERIADTQRELAASKSVSLIVHSGHPACAVFDEAQMRRAIENLVLNAIQNTPANGFVEIVAERNADQLTLRVSDTGLGVPEAIRDGLFEPFVTARSEGTGLGLAIAREIARAHGGDVTLRPAEHGSVFEISVPWRMS